MNYYILGQAKLLMDPHKAINLQENMVLKKLAYYRTLIKQIDPIDYQIKSQLQNVCDENDKDYAEGDNEEEYEAEGEYDEEAELDNESENENILDVEVRSQNSQGQSNSEPEDLEEPEEIWNKNIPKKSKTSHKPSSFKSIENMLNFGSVTKAADQEQTLEVKEMNKIIDKVNKKNTHKTATQNNIDDMVSDDEDMKKAKWKRRMARLQKNKPVDPADDYGNFGGEGLGIAQDQDDDEDIPEQTERIDVVKLKKREEKELRRKEKHERIQSEVEAKNLAISKNMNRTIMKGKGLYRKRPSKLRNPRMKHKLKYEKKMKDRHRLVQEFKEGPQKKYAGELTGIRSNLRRSDKF
jgi:U3 small nucleolar RNA-associated protein 3